MKFNKAFILAFFLLAEACSQKAVNTTHDQGLTKTHEVHFGFDSAGLKASEAHTLQAILDEIKAQSEEVFVVEGHTDIFGSDQYNLELGDRRARNLKAFLISRGIDSKRIVTVSFGEGLPKDKRPAKNRRVVIKPASL